MGEPNLLKLRYRDSIREIVKSIILERIPGAQTVSKIRELIDLSNTPEDDRTELFGVIETEIISLHEGNVARFKVRPSEFQAWKEAQ